MSMSQLLDKAEQLLGEARHSYANKYFVKAERCLVELRELLNSQPELEAGGTVETDKCKGCGFRIAKGAVYCSECKCENDGI